MSIAVAESNIYSLHEPRPPYHCSDNRPPQKQSAHNKQLTRILVHLRDQIRQGYPQIPLPSQWMLSALVDNASKACDFSKEQLPDWHAELCMVLDIIHEACDVGLDKPCPFVQKDGTTPLFPNHELFDEWDVYRFSQALIHYLRSL